MAVKVNKVHDNLEDHGNDWRIERRFRPEADGTHHWVVYEKQTVEDTVLPKKDASGNVTEPGKMGTHPVHGEPTTFTYVWIPRFNGPEEQARDYIAKRAR